MFLYMKRVQYTCPVIVTFWVKHLTQHQYNYHNNCGSSIGCSISGNLSLHIRWSDRYDRFCMGVYKNFCSRSIIWLGELESSTETRFPQVFFKRCVIKNKKEHPSITVRYVLQKNSKYFSRPVSCSFYCPFRASACPIFIWIVSLLLVTQKVPQPYLKLLMHREKSLHF